MLLVGIDGEMDSHRLLVCMLYKSILRLQRGLPKDLQLLGTKYVKDEFRRHKNASPQEAAIFLKEWTNYGVELATQLNPKSLKTGLRNIKTLDDSTLDKMREDQVAQLYELLKATKSP